MDRVHVARALGLSVGRKGRLLGKRVPAEKSVWPIEKGVHLTRSRNYVGLREPLTKLPAAEPGMVPNVSFVTSASKNGCYSMAKKLGIRINVRKETATTVRVWRVDEEKKSG